MLQQHQVDYCQKETTQSLSQTLLCTNERTEPNEVDSLRNVRPHMA